MERMCAWCQKSMGTTPAESPAEKVITHGICRECADKVYAERGLDLTSFLDRLDAPVIVVDESGSVQTANKQARMFFGKEFSDIAGYQGGDVFKCAYASLPEGCGNTIHCSGCTIRRAVMETHATGKPIHRTPAFLMQPDSDDRRKMNLFISTRKVGRVVLLKIDELV